MRVHVYMCISMHTVAKCHSVGKYACYKQWVCEKMWIFFCWYICTYIHVYILTYGWEALQLQARQGTQSRMFLIQEACVFMYIRSRLWDSWSLPPPPPSSHLISSPFWWPLSYPVNIWIFIYMRILDNVYISIPFAAAAEQSTCSQPKPHQTIILCYAIRWFQFFDINSSSLSTFLSRTYLFIWIYSIMSVIFPSA